LKNSSAKIYNRQFSHVYVEENIFDNNKTLEILSKFQHSNIIKIKHYKDIFCRKNQNCYIQKRCKSLIIAEKENNDNLIYRGAAVCQDFGNSNFYYTSNVMNCIYDCEYCYLQGMYSTSNIVVFINTDNIFAEAEKLLKNNSLYLCISYDTDILALENILGYVKEWVKFAAKHKNIKIEIRTKSANFNSIKNIKPSDNIILAWTLTPNEIIYKYEHNTPSLKNRIENIKCALNSGWKVRICFDPIIKEKNFEQIYKNLFDDVFCEINSKDINDVSIGTFRISHDYLKKMKKQCPYSPIVNYPFKLENGVFSYGSLENDLIINTIKNMLLNYISEEKIFIWKG